MRTEQRMDQDYDYHMNTGGLPEYYGNGSQNNDGCFWLLAICVFIVVCVYMCASDDKDKNTTKPIQEVVVPTNIENPAPIYQAPETVSLAPANVDRHTPKVENKPVEVTPYIPTKKLSAAYEEGYERGYEDGEEDAYSHSGWQTSFDDDCKYKGKKKADYEEGYEDGYEAGYDDNMSDYDD